MFNHVICIANRTYLKNNCMSNSQVIARDETECNFDCYEYNYSLVELQCMRLHDNHVAVPITILLTLKVFVGTN